MKKNIRISSFVLASLLVAFSSEAQINIKKPKIKVETPKVNVGNDKSDDSGTSIVPKSDPSGLFNRITDDPSARSHRATAVEKLELLEAEYATEVVNYSTAEGLITEIDKRLGMVLKLEPNVGKDKFDERYNAVKSPVLTDLEVIKPMKTMAITFRTKFNADDEYQATEVLAYRQITGYRDAAECYCREHEQTGTFLEYSKLKEEYRALGQKVPKYKDEVAEKSIYKMDNCIANGIKYADAVAKEGYKTDIIDFSTKKKPMFPEEVITKCEKYLAGLDLIKTDPSLNLPASSITGLENTKAEVSRIKTEAEVYISSGEFKKHKAAVRAELAKSVYMPDAGAKNSSLESQAIAYIKGQEFNKYLSNANLDFEIGTVATVIKAITLDAQFVVKKNNLDIPQYQYKEMVVAYKDTDGICQMVSVYAEYTYKGGGVYASAAIWSADAPIQIACENVNK